MSGPDHSSEPLDPAKVAAQVAAIADHLNRAGVHWLPKPSDEQVELLRARMIPGHDEGTEPKESNPPSLAGVDDREVAEHLSSPPSPAHNHPETKVRSANVSHGRLQPVAAVTSLDGPYPGDPLGQANREAMLAQLEQLVSECDRCEELAGCRKKTVFGEGNATPRVTFFGEGPGADEDRTGRPFVGRAGQLLTKMIEACKFQRSDVYILNTVKCRPPGNRNPEPDEINRCREYYQQQLAILRPEYIVCLGAVSAQELLQSKLSVGRLRGKLHRYYESKVLVTYHPAYLLRNPAAKKAAWEDLQLLLRDAGISY